MNKHSASAAIRALEPFQSGPLEGVRVAPSLYVVKSYGAPLAVAYGSARIVASSAATATSARHAGQVRREWMGSYSELPPATLAAILPALEALPA